MMLPGSQAHVGEGERRLEDARGVELVRSAPSVGDEKGHV